MLPAVFRSPDFVHLVAPAILKVSPRSSASGLQTRKEHSEEDFVRGFLGAKSRDVASVFCPHSPGQNRVTWPNLTARSGGKDIQLDAQEGEEMEFGKHRATPPHCRQLVWTVLGAPLTVLPCGHFPSLVLSSDLRFSVLFSALSLLSLYAPCPLPSSRDLTLGRVLSRAFLPFSTPSLGLQCNPTQAFQVPGHPPSWALTAWPALSVMHSVTI